MSLFGGIIFGMSGFLLFIVVLIGNNRHDLKTEKIRIVWFLWDAFEVRRTFNWDVELWSYSILKMKELAGLVCLVFVSHQG